MKLTKCPLSHFYDADKYDDCPHCSAKQSAARQTETKDQSVVRTTQSAIPQTQSQQTSQNGMTVSFKQAVNHSGFESPEEAAPKTASEPKVESVDEALHAFAKFGSIFRKPSAEKQSEAPSASTEDDTPPPKPTAAPVQQSPASSAAPMPSPKPTAAPVQQSPASPAAPMPSPKPTAAPVQQSPASPAAPMPSPKPTAAPVQQPTVQAVKQVSAQSSELAQAVAAAKEKPAADDGRTMAYYQFADSEPVVGWLIGLSGFYFGESFNLKAGHNFIGRSLSMDVALVEEKSISREYHANIIYDPKSRKFFIQPGRSNGLTYLNGELLMTPAELHIYNRIQLGDQTYIFMPFCGRNFSWEDYINED